MKSTPVSIAVPNAVARVLAVAVASVMQPQVNAPLHELITATIEDADGDPRQTWRLVIDAAHLERVEQ